MVSLDLSHSHTLASYAALLVSHMQAVTGCSHNPASYFAVSQMW
jgi:hypothetical protein